MNIKLCSACYKAFKSSIHSLFPAIYDTKHISSSVRKVCYCILCLQVFNCFFFQEIRYWRIYVWCYDKISSFHDKNSSISIGGQLLDSAELASIECEVAYRHTDRLPVHIFNYWPFVKNLFFLHLLSLWHYSKTSVPLFLSLFATWTSVSQFHAVFDWWHVESILLWLQQ